MNGICLVAGLLLAPLGDHITLRWQHSIEKVRWEEDYRLEAGALLLTEARVRGTGAGMEPPEQAVFEGGEWHYRPALPPLPQLELRQSPYVAPYTICTERRCALVTAWLPGLPEEAILVLKPCETVGG